MEIRKVFKVSNSLGCIIPKSVANELGLKLGDYVAWEIDKKASKASIRKIEGKEGEE